MIKVNIGYKIISKAPKTNFYFSDVYKGYQNLSYVGRHFYFRDKSHTFTVEGVNSDIRKYILTLQRRSKCFFRSLDSFKFVINLFVYFYNKFGFFKFMFPKLKFGTFLIDFIPYP